MDIDSGGVTIHVEVTGEGRPVLLLHGFPDSGACWRHQVPALVDAGFQVIVPDLRGFGASDAPDGVETVLDPPRGGRPGGRARPPRRRPSPRGGPRFRGGHGLGHGRLPARPRRPPGRALSVGQASAFRSVGVSQMEKSWYMFFFQFPGVGEQWLAADDWANFRAWCHHPDADAVIARWESTGTLTAALNWYRANIPPEGFVAPALELPAVAAPTMGMWSTGDFALTEAQMVNSAAYVSGPWRYERVEGPGHWLQLETPDVVNGLLVDFLPA